jgi:hypothetical protein
MIIDKKKFLEVLYVGALGSVAILFRDKPFWILAILDWVQFTLIFVILALAVNDERVYGTQNDRASKAVAQFLRYWKNLWRVWLALYVIFAASNTFIAIHKGPLNVPYWNGCLNVIANTVNNLQSFYIFLLFVVMTKNTTHEPGRLIQLTSEYMLTVIAIFGAFEVIFSVLAPMIFNSANDPHADLVSHIAGIFFSTFSGLF